MSHTNMACPSCKARAGHACRAANGRARNPHVARRKLAAEIARGPSPATRHIEALAASPRPMANAIGKSIEQLAIALWIGDITPFDLPFDFDGQMSLWRRFLPRTRELWLERARQLWLALVAAGLA